MDGDLAVVPAVRPLYRLTLAESEVQEDDDQSVRLVNRMQSHRHRDDLAKALALASGLLARLPAPRPVEVLVANPARWQLRRVRGSGRIVSDLLRLIGLDEAMLGVGALLLLVWLVVRLEWARSDNAKAHAGITENIDGVKQDVRDVLMLTQHLLDRK